MSPRGAGLRSAVAVAALLATMAGCEGAVDDRRSFVEGAEVASGWRLGPLRTDLAAPTQITTSVLPHPVDGKADPLWVAELVGAEDEPTARVRLLDAEEHPGDDVASPLGEEQPVLDRLLAPTGVAALPADGDTQRVIVQEPRRLVSMVADGAGDPIGEPVEIGEPLPFNGRSQGTLTVTPDGRVLHVATGTGSGPDPTEGSGVLYALRPGLDGSDVVAVGFKNAYAHAFGPDGELYVTEIGDGRYDDGRPPDELNVITPDVLGRATRGGEPYDGGWPRCTGEGDPTEEFGATVEECAALPSPVATFRPGATPTGVAVARDGTVLVALWIEGRVVEVDPVTGAVTDVVTGLDRPQHLLSLPDGRVMVTVHGTGQLLELSRLGVPG